MFRRILFILPVITGFAQTTKVASSLSNVIPNTLIIQYFKTKSEISEATIRNMLVLEDMQIKYCKGVPLILDTNGIPKCKEDEKK